MRLRYHGGCTSIAILVMISAGAELATFMEVHIVRVLYKSSESTLKLRLAPDNTTRSGSVVTYG